MTNNDDDFVDPPLRRQRSPFSVRSSMDPPMEPHKVYIDSSMDEGTTAQMSPPHAVDTD